LKLATTLLSLWVAVAPFTGAWIETLPADQPPHEDLSRPSRARGLKLVTSCPAGRAIGSRPSRARGLKLKQSSSLRQNEVSRPSRARGLKLDHLQNSVPLLPVAPFTGAWIETLLQPRIDFVLRSRPSRARGLKLVNADISVIFQESRPSRARGLKLRRRRPQRAMACRALHGRVD